MIAIAVPEGAVSALRLSPAEFVQQMRAADVSVSFFVYSRDGCYELLAV